MGTATPQPGAISRWRLDGIGILRIAFGVVWGIDAWFKWQPDFVDNFVTYLKGAQQGQPWPVHHWIGFWVNVVNVDPHAFAYLVAAGETLVALALILGLFSNQTYVVGILLSIVIWTTAEGLVVRMWPGRPISEPRSSTYWCSSGSSSARPGSILASTGG